MRILIRGGSIAAGIGVMTSYAHILTDYGSSRCIEVLNRSRINDTSFDGVRSFQEDIEPYRPNILMLHFGVDDAYLSVYRSEFKENLVQMVRQAKTRFNPAIMLLTSHTFDDPYDMEALNIYYRVIREVSVDLACEMIPVHTYWQGYLESHQISNRALVQEDVRYPNEQGHLVFASAIIQRVQAILATNETISNRKGISS